MDGDKDGQAICDMGAFEWQQFEQVFFPLVVKSWGW
jgi:ABC-type spermidine/putrescine transport system permease subunit I